MYNTNVIDWSTYTFRCSSLGHIMSDGKGKSFKQQLEETRIAMGKTRSEIDACSEKAIKTKIKYEAKFEELFEKAQRLELIQNVPNLSETCKTHLSDIYTAVVYGRETEDIKSKYLQKGLACEEDAITQYSLLTGEFHKKNKERKFNAWINGENDFFDDTWINDIKVNWSIFQFNRVVSKPIKPLYHWQLDGYMWLWDIPKGRLIYSLVNTPEPLILIEEKKLLYDFVGSEQDYRDACDEIRLNHIYDDIPLHKKVRTFEVIRSDERIERIKERVEDCRKYLAEFDNIKIENEDEAED